MSFIQIKIPFHFQELIIAVICNICDTLSKENECVTQKIIWFPIVRKIRNSLLFTCQKEKSCFPPVRKKGHGVYILERKVMVSTCQKESHLPVRKKRHGVHLSEKKVMVSTF
jgi:hypothetical protein